MMMASCGSMRSARPSTALATQPTTNPTCTALVSAACANFDSPYCATKAGTTADAENQSAIAPTWQRAMIAIDVRLEAIVAKEGGDAAVCRRGLR